MANVDPSDGDASYERLAATGLPARTVAALAYADAITTDDVDDALFAATKRHFTDDEMIELTMAIAWENSSARFNRALRVPAQGLWEPS